MGVFTPQSMVSIEGESLDGLALEASDNPMTSATPALNAYDACDAGNQRTVTTLAERSFHACIQPDDAFFGNGTERLSVEPRQRYTPCALQQSQMSRLIKIVDSL